MVDLVYHAHAMWSIMGALYSIPCTTDDHVRVQDGTVCLWSPATGVWLETLHAHESWVMALVMGRRGEGALF